VTNAFNGDTGFLASLDKACEQFINNNSVTDEAGRQKSPELVARYCNLLLRKAEKNLEEAELQEKLKKVVRRRTFWNFPFMIWPLALKLRTWANAAGFR